MIKSRKDYLDYLEADRIALQRPKRTLSRWIKGLLVLDHIWIYQRTLRKAEYYGNVRKDFLGRFYYFFVKMQFRKWSVRLGFSIPENAFGPGLAIVHYGTIIVNPKAKIGSNCRIHADTNIGASGGSAKAPVIGNNVYLAPGVKIYGDISIANNTAIGPNSVVNKSFPEENTFIAGIPAKVIKTIDIKKIIKHS